MSERANLIKLPPDIRPPHESLRMVMRPRDIMAWGEPVTIAHLTKQEVVNLPCLRDLLDKNPQIHVVSTSFNLYQRMASKPAFQGLLLERGIDCAVGRMVDRSGYSQRIEDERFQQKKNVFFEAQEDPEKAAILERMRELGFVGLEVAERYFRNGSISIVTISAELGIPYEKARRQLGAMLNFLGVEYKDLEVIRANRVLSKMLDPIDKEAEK